MYTIFTLNFRNTNRALRRHLIVMSILNILFITEIIPKKDGK